MLLDAPPPNGVSEAVYRAETAQDLAAAADKGIEQARADPLQGSPTIFSSLKSVVTRIFERASSLLRSAPARLSISTFAPPAVKPGQHFIVHTWVHSPDDHGIAERQAQQSDHSATARQSTMIPGGVSAGDQVMLSLNASAEGSLANFVKSLEWRAEASSAQFVVPVEDRAEPFDLFVEIGAQISGSTLSSGHTIRVPVTADGRPPLSVEAPPAPPPDYAFFSYASEDRPVVERIAEDYRQRKSSLLSRHRVPPRGRSLARKTVRRGVEIRRVQSVLVRSGGGVEMGSPGDALGAADP